MVVRRLKRLAKMLVQAIQIALVARVESSTAAAATSSYERLSTAISTAMHYQVHPSSSGEKENYAKLKRLIQAAKTVEQHIRKYELKGGVGSRVSAAALERERNGQQRSWYRAQLEARLKAAQEAAAAQRPH